MKKCWILILSILLLLLCGCGQQASNTSENITLPADLPEAYKVTIIDGHAEEPFYWGLFYKNANAGNVTAIELCYQQDGNQRNALLYFDGVTYILSDERGTRAYKHLIYSPQYAPDSADYDYAEFFLLSDDPNMTSERYFQATLSSSMLLQNLAPTELVYMDYLSFPQAEKYGTVPKQMPQILESFLAARKTTWEKTSYFQTEQLTDAEGNQVGDEIRRYDYQANLLTTVNVSAAGTIFELNDGRFLVEDYNDANGQNSLICFNADGSVSWQYGFKNGYGFSTPYLFQKNNDIYTFGSFRPSAEPYTQTDILICRFSSDGKLLQEERMGGSGFDRLYRIWESRDGFNILGSTQSRDGDFPFSRDGIPAYFSAYITLSLELSDLQTPAKKDYDTLVGYHQGMPVYEEDHIFSEDNTDRLPAEKDDYGYKTYSTLGIFNWDQGYVILRMHSFDHYYLSPNMTSYTPSYRELIITGYDNSGNALWQTTSDIYVS